jgi:DNA-binding NtrC family response regulator
METVATVPGTPARDSSDDRRGDTRPTSAKDVVVVIGPSGSGKRTAIGILEDLFGYSAVTKVTLGQLLPVVDAMPTNRLALQVLLAGSETLLASGYGPLVDECVECLLSLRRRCRRFQILFLYCVQEQLVHRQTVGYHPFWDLCGTLKAAIFKECEMLVQLFWHLAADPTLGRDIGFVDTSELSLTELKGAIDEHMIARSETAGASQPGSFITRGWNLMRKTLGEVERQHARFVRETQVSSTKAPDALPGRLNCLLLGETGVGKELIAKYLAGGDERLIQLNCEGIPRELLESELWGHVRGAFTHAVRDRQGLVSQAVGKTLFVDEIGFADPVVQQKLLRFIETRRYKKLGSDKLEGPIDCRIIAATSRDLEKDVRNGTFLPDLYYRIAGVTITIPPLRQRREDVPILVDKFIEGDSRKRFSPEALAILFDHGWGGNVRLLRNTVEQCRLLTGTIQEEDLPSQITRPYDGLREYHDRVNVRFRLSRTELNQPTDTYKERFKMAVLVGHDKHHRDTAMKEILRDRLAANGSNVMQTARELKLHRSTVYRYMSKFGIRAHRKAGLLS